MFSRVEITRNPKTMHIGRYPWERLAQPGDQLILFGKAMSGDGATQSAYAYAKRHGWHVRAHKMGMTADGWVVDVVRVS